MKCDVTKWEDQLEMFREAVNFSPSGNIDIVVANAGLVSLQDSIFTPESRSAPKVSNLHRGWFPIVAINENI